MLLACSGPRKTKKAGATIVTPAFRHASRMCAVLFLAWLLLSRARLRFRLQTTKLMRPVRATKF